MSDLEGALQVETPPPPYIIFVVVFLFFITGLCGFLVCHMLKLKGYRCTMEEDEDDEEELEEEADDDNEESQDTVEQILKCIIENEANMEAFNEMLGKGNVCVRHDQRLRKESIGGIPPHLHTVHSGTDLHDTCHLCTQSRSKRGRRPSRTPRFRQRPGQQTVFSVGRFRVTHDKKSGDNSGRVPDVLVGSGDHLDQSLDSEERRDGGYSLQNMFKDVRPPSESTNSMAPKRRRSLTIFGLRRGSDPIDVKVVGTGREGVRFIPHPIVLEEPQNENEENRHKEMSKLRRGSLQIATSQNKASPNVTVIKTQTKVSIDVESSSQGPNLQSQDTPALETSPPNSLLMPFSCRSPKSTSLQVVGRKIDQNAQLSPGPLQTSTPLSPDSKEIISQFATEATVPQGLTGSQTPPDPCISPVLEHDSFDSPVLISLGSSPHSSIRTPTSLLLVTPSPNFSSKVSSQTASSPKFLSSQPSGLSMRPLDKSLASLPTSSPSVSLQDDALPLGTTSQETRLQISTSQTKLEASMTQTSMPELKNLGTLGGDKSSPQLSPTSPLGGRVSSVTIIKASPDSKREFSVVTMMEERKRAFKDDIEDSGDSGGAEVKWTLGDEKEEMVEMEEISECRVTQVGEVGTEENAMDEATRERRTVSTMKQTSGI